tara:strand:+ start:111 stop:1103 length:993 start_codon:yes stop_codon:yes gene_type:complete
MPDPKDPKKKFSNQFMGKTPLKNTEPKDPLAFMNNIFPASFSKPKEKQKPLTVYDNLPYPIEKMDKFGLTKKKIEIENQRKQYLKNDPGYGVLQNPTQSVDFDSLISDDIHKWDDKEKKTKVTKSGKGEAKAFLDRYNDPITRKRMKKQIGVTDADIDNMIIKGLKAEKHDGGNSLGSNADTWTMGGKDQIFFGKKHLHNKATETHERIHSSKMDDPMGIALQKVLGNANDQKKFGTTRDGKGYTPQKTRTYLNKPGETYGNFAGFREELGMKPGEQIDEARMRKIIKEKKIESNFSNVYDDDKIVKALNTIASTDTKKDKLKKYKYRLT